MDILEKIVEHKKEEVKRLKINGICLPPDENCEKRGFRDALLEARPIGIIAEVKKASPSKGLLCPDFDPESLCKEYQQGGADCISVLTDERFFQGRLEYLFQVKRACSLPVLRKDFIIDHIQVEEAEAWGADAILLICAILDVSLLKELLSHANELGMDCLVEVHDEGEAEKAIISGANLIGINNRNLKDFSVSLETSIRVRSMIPKQIPVVSESGIRDEKDIEVLASSEIRAALIGESLVRASNRPEKIRQLKGFQRD